MWLLVFLFLLAGCRQDPASPGTVDWFDLEIEIAPDGSARVRETFAVRSAGSFGHRIAGGRTDGFEEASASIDGQAGTSMTSGDNLSILWRLPSDAAATRILEARYRALGVVEIEGMRGTFRWPILPAGRAYDVGAATVSVKLPQGTRLLQEPAVESPGWHWTTTLTWLAGLKPNVARAEPATLSVEFALDAVPMLEPRWQTRALLGHQLTPSFIAAALFILVTAAGILYAIRLQYFHRPRDAEIVPRPDVARGLRMAGLVVIVLGLASAAVAYAILRPLGPWTQAVPASLILAGLWFSAAGRWYSRSGPQ